MKPSILADLPTRASNESLLYSVLITAVIKLLPTLSSTVGMGVGNRGSKYAREERGGCRGVRGTIIGVLGNCWLAHGRCQKVVREVVATKPSELAVRNSVGE